MLGPLEVRDDAGSVLDVSGLRLRALLILLALRAGQVVPASYLIDELWGDRLPADAGNALQALVSRLRRAIPDAEVVSRPAGYQLRLEPGAVDVFRFERLAARGHARLREDPATAAAALTEALALWRGPALADAEQTESGRAAIVRLGELRLAATEGRIDAELRLAGQSPPGPRLIAELDGLLAANPARETLAALLMRAQAAAGRPGQALETYEQVRARLADDLGADPSPALAALHLEILRADAPPAGPDPVTEVTNNAAAEPRTNLRAQLTSFVGRDADLGRVGAMLREHRLVTLTGPGGAGKTRLAAEAARAALVAFPGGAWLAELAPVTDPADVVATVLAAFGLREQALLQAARAVPAVDSRASWAIAEANADPLDRLVAALATRRALLVLDNCEHLVVTAAQLADRVLAGCPQMRVLATSREPLNITGEALWPVGPLAQSWAERLFTERARAVCPGFSVTEENADAVRGICQALDGMPLAIELAAARTRTMTAEQIAVRLDDRFRLLTGGSRTALPRHQTLRAVVDWSWDLLSEAERAMLRRLSVFTGGATLEAAWQVCSGRPLPVAREEVLDLLTALADKSLLTVRHTQDGPRYGMLEIILAYGRERLAEAGEQEQLRRAHASFFVALAESDPDDQLGAGQVGWLRRMAADQDNLHAAIRGAVRARDGEMAARLLAAVGWYWWLRSLKKEGADLATEVLDMIAALPDEARRAIAPERLAVANAMAGMIAFDTPRQDTARELLDTATRIAAGLPDVTDPLLRLAGALAEVVGGGGAPPCAVIDAAVEDPHPWVSAVGRVLRGQMALNYGQPVAAAEADFRAAVASFEELGERWGTAMAVGAVAQLEGWHGQFAAAAADYQRAAELAGELGTTEDKVLFRVWLARQLWLLGGSDRERSRGELASALHDADELNWPEVTAFAAYTAGDLARLDGDLATARAHLTRAVEVAEDAGSVRPFRAITYASLGYLASAAGDLAAARAHHERAVAYALPTKDGPVIAQTVAGLADLALREGDPERAATLLGASEALRGAPDRSVPDEARVAAAASAVLGEPKYGAAFQRGRRLSLATLDEVLGPALTPGAGTP
jgi:predicted ATPase/DNA-binding SARP family transcriptional activator